MTHSRSQSRIAPLVSVAVLLTLLGCAARVDDGQQAASAGGDGGPGPVERPAPDAGGASYDAATAADLDNFRALFEPDRAAVARALRRIDEGWHPGNVAMLVEILPLLSDGAAVGGTLDVLHEKTGQRLGFNVPLWHQWIWRREYEPHPRYAEFKAWLYSNMDPSFAEYFDDTSSAVIRLDEILWGGVQRDGIPPLAHPKLLAAAEATYLDDTNVVFGVEVDGDARAYPKRILAWHEMVKDTVGGDALCGVYCTLCGSMIVYRAEFEGQHHELGTSGFLYRSNKLMYDHETRSLWSTLTGEPVVGPLVGRGIALERRSVVTTTWGEWRRRHPDTKVLSLDTGHRRDYGEGAAYREYFATDQLMFGVPLRDPRLKNKAQVLALRFEAAPGEQLAIATDFLAEHPVYHDRLGEQEFVVLTDSTGASRVYETGGRRFKSWDADATVVDEENQPWTLSEARLTSAGGQSLRRLPGHRAFWFGWYAAYPGTRLVR